MKQLFLIFVLSLSHTLYGADTPVREITLDDERVILTNLEGLTLYTFDLDGPGQSNCFDGCLSVWPRALVDADTVLEAPYGSISFDNGERQLTLNDAPLYLFFQDKGPGDILGDNLQGVWHIILKNQGLK